MSEQDLSADGSVGIDSFTELYEQQCVAVVQYFQRRTLCPEVAADLTSETFAVAFSSRKNYVDQGSTTVAWIFGIARNQLRRYHRRHAVSERARNRLRIANTPLSTDDLDAVERLVDREWRAQILDVLYEELTASEQKTIEMRIGQGLPYSKIAADLECTEGAARVRVSRALTKLADRLEKLCPDPQSHF